MLVGVSIFNVLKKNLNLNSAKFFAGHSLGEYTALVCAGSLTIEQAVYLLHERGKSMQEAVPPNQGSMIAVLGMKISEIEDEIKILPQNEICEIANDNCNGQVVVSGEAKTIQTLNENLKKKKKRGIVLPVSAPFHCSMMKSAAEKMKDKINKTNFVNFNPPVVSNVTAKDETDTNLVKSLLIDQITSRVRWRESVNYMIKSGVTDFLEIGPGKVLSGLVKKINRDVKISNINTLDDVKND
jgi:[acyl-carrier-protein] S-malonyltransferase